MFVPSKLYRRGTLAVLAACGLLAPLVFAGPAGAAVQAGSSSRGSVFGFSAGAYSTYATAAGKAVSPAAAATGFSCATEPQAVSNSGTGQMISIDKSTAGALNNQASWTSSGNTSAATATSTTQSVNLLGGKIKTTGVTQTATASETSGTWSASGTSKFTGLTIAGKNSTGSPAPNTRVNLAGIGTVYLNYQVKSVSKTGASMNTDAMIVDVTQSNTLGIPVGATIIVGHASAQGAGPLSGTLGGGANATAVSGSEGTSSASYAAGVACMGSSSTATNGAGVTFSPVNTGAVNDTATGIDNATTLSAATSSTVSRVAVSKILSMGGVKATASAAKSGSGVTTSGSVTLTSPKLLGTNVPTLPAHPSANYTVKINGVTLVLNRQVKTANGITVQAMYLTGKSIGTIVVGSASAYAYPG